MSTQYRLSPGTAFVRRPHEVGLLPLDGRLDPDPVVIRESGVEICEALRSWVSLDDLVARFNSEQAPPPDEIAAGVREFVTSLRELGIVSTRDEPDAAESTARTDEPAGEVEA
ncbi:PqqD family peptide modification chaperone [Flexivirga sp. B27]